MPRLLPRLRAIVEKEPPRTEFLPFDVKKHRTRRPKSLYRPILREPSFVPDTSQSILLKPENPIAAPGHYVRRKTLPPRVYVPKDSKKRVGEHDAPREMTEEELEWWSSPYLRMLATPPRMCAISNRLFPSAFLLRLSPLATSLAPSAATVGANTPPVSAILVPDGLLSSKFTSRRSNRATHVFCSRQSLSFILSSQKLVHIPYYVLVPPNLPDHVSHLLRLRVLQELELMITRLGAAKKENIFRNPPVRRLESHEWQRVLDENVVPWKNAVAIIHVPPIPQPNDIEPSMSAAPLPPDVDEATNMKREVAKMHYISDSRASLSDLPTNFQYRDVLPAAKVPIYDGLGLMPHVAQRAMLIQLLSKAASLYDAAALKSGYGSTSEDAKNWSDAYLVSSSSQIVKMNDMPELAIALWRVYLFERDILREKEFPRKRVPRQR